MTLIFICIHSDIKIYLNKFEIS